MIITLFILSVIVISLGYGIYFSDPMLGNMMMVHYARILSKGI